MKCFLLCCWLGLALLSSAVPAGVNVWTTGGPFGANTSALLVDPQTPNVIYAGTEGGGVFKSHNWGQSWSAANTGMGGGVIVYALAMDPADHMVLYAATNIGLCRTTDGAKSWTPPAQGLPALLLLAVAPSDGRILYGGNSWEGMYKSTNHGASWTPINTGLGSYSLLCLAVDPVDASRVYAGTMNSGVYRTTNGGSSWTSANSGLNDSHVASLIVSPEAHLTLYAGTSSAGVRKSTDGGDSWGATGSISGTAGALAFDVLDPQVVYAGAGFDVYLSTNAGESWTDPDPGQFAGPVRALAADPRAAGRLFAATRHAGVYRSLDQGVSWRTAHQGLNGYSVGSVAVNPADPNIVLAGTQGSGLFRSEDDGRSWAGVAGALPLYFESLAFDPVSPLVVYAAANADGVYKSTDGGAAWAAANNGLPVSAFGVTVDPADHQRLYAATATGPYKSTNSGSSWSPANAGITGPPCYVVAVDPVDPSVLYTGTFSSGVFKSTNGGTSWNTANSGLLSLTVDGVYVHPASHTTVFAGTANGLYRSTDGGAHWAFSGTGMGSVLVSSLVFDPAQPAVMYAGTQAGIFRSADTGENWTLHQGGLPELQCISLARAPAAGGTLHAGMHGGVFSLTETEDPTLSTLFRDKQSGRVNPLLASQPLPASYLTLGLAPQTYPGASASNPVIIELELPAGAVLSQTLADGDLGSLDPVPEGKRIVPLAVSEYALDAGSSAYVPVDSAPALIGLPFQAVQLFRYVAGEGKLYLRLLDSTADWLPGAPGHLVGVTVGLGAGVWPPTGATNWGADGIHRQGSTQLFCDLRSFDFSATDGHFPVTIKTYYQVSGIPPGAGVFPNPVDLFRQDGGTEEAAAANAQSGAQMTDYTTADLDGDGREDIVSVDALQGRLYWTLGTADGSFGGLEWRDLLTAAPLAVEAADVTGDGLPDVLVADASGQLTVYTWENLFAPIIHSHPDADRTLAPDAAVLLAGTASASVVRDLNADGWTDFVYTDSGAGTLNVLLGQTFTSQASYATGSQPVALTVADFDGDGAGDVAVANRGGNSVSVYRNNGAGALSRTDFAAGSQPVSIAAGDFNRDGRADLAVALAGDKAVGAWKAGAGGTFTAGLGQRIYFQNPPSAIQADNFDGANGADVLVGFSDYYKLALLSSDTAGGLAYAYAINTLGDVELDPVNHVTMTEDNVLSVAGGTSAGGVCTRSGVAAVAQQSFDLVHLPRSQDLSFSVVNLGAQSALLNLELYEDAGTLRRAATVPVGPGQQYARYLSTPELFGSEADNPARWTRGFVTAADTYGFWLANDGRTLDYLDGLALANVRDARSEFVLAMAPAAFGSVTAFLLNPNLEPAQVTVRRVGGGSVLGSQRLILPGRGRTVIAVGSAFPGMSVNDYLQVQADRPILGCEVYGDGQKLAALAGLVAPPAATTLYCPHVASGDLGASYETWLTLVNPTEQGAVVTLWLYGDGGQLLGSAPPVTVGARSKVHRNFVTLFGVAEAVTGSIVAEVAGGGAVTGAVTFGEAGAGRFLSSLPLRTQPGADFLVGHIANGTLGTVAFFTGLAVLNPGAANVAAEVAAYDQNGLPQGTAALAVAGHAREVFLLDQRLPGLQSQFGGYLRIRVTAGEGVMVFALFGDQPLNFLSAVEAQPVRE